MIKLGANVNVLNREGDYPLHYAAQRGKKQVVEKLLKLGAEPDVRNVALETPLFLAVAGGFIELTGNDIFIEKFCDKFTLKFFYPQPETFIFLEKYFSDKFTLKNFFH